MKNKKNLISVLVVVGILAVVSCAQINKDDGPNPVVDKELAGTWVNDNTPDISFTINLYDLKGEVRCGDRIFPTTFKTRGQDGYMSTKDLSSDTSYFDWYMKNISDDGNTSLTNLHAKYENGKIHIFDNNYNRPLGLMLKPDGHTMLPSQNIKYGSYEYHRLMKYKEVVGTYTKK